MKRAALRARISPARIQAEAAYRERVVWSGEAAFASLDELADVIARLASESSVPCCRLTVLLQPPLVQTRTIPGLPAVRAGSLAALVAQQPGRFFRKNGVPLVTNAAWQGKAGASAARAVAVEEPLLDAVIAGARSAGLVLETIRVDGAGAGLELLPTRERRVRQRRSRRRVGWMAALAAAVWVAAGAVYVTRLEGTRRRVVARLAAVQAPLAAVLAARRQLRDVEAALLVVGEADVARGRTLELLGRLTATLPDSVVLTSLVLRADGGGVVSGLARRAASVAQRLEEASFVANARLEGPVTRETAGGTEWERFTLAFDGARSPR